MRKDDGEVPWSMSILSLGEGEGGEGVDVEDMVLGSVGRVSRETGRCWSELGMMRMEGKMGRMLRIINVYLGGGYQEFISPPLVASIV